VDKGGVEARGKAVRQQALVPIPVGPTPVVLNAALLAQMDVRLDTQRDAQDCRGSGERPIVRQFRLEADAHRCRTPGRSPVSA
jgi:hypothetical protein